VEVILGTIATLYCKLGPGDVLGQSAELNEEDFNLGSLLLGRSPSVAISIPDEEVSRLHCSLNYSSKTGLFTLTDEASTNGTHLNGEALEPHKPYQLRHGDEIQLGFTSFTFNLSQPQQDRSQEQALARLLLQSYGWEVIQPKGFQHWIVPKVAAITDTEEAWKGSLEQAFASSAAIGLNLTSYTGRRALMEKYLVVKSGRHNYEAYVLFLNGRIIGAYVAEGERIMPLSILYSATLRPHYNQANTLHSES